MSKSYIDDDGEAREIDEAWFREAKRGRPPMLEADRKRRVNLMLDPDVIKALKATGNMSEAVNSTMRKTLGIDSAT